jgi:CheY-like chemotaxis protein
VLFGTANLNILLVEDEPLVAMGVEDMLKSLGYRLAGTMKDCAGALAMVEESAPDLVLLDVNLGRETSFDVAHLCEAKHIPVVFTTGYGVHDMPAEWRHHPTISKPFGAAELEGAVRAAMAPLRSAAQA